MSGGGDRTGWLGRQDSNLGMSRFDPFPISLKYRRDFAKTSRNRITGDFFANELQDGGFCTRCRSTVSAMQDHSMISRAGNQQQHSPGMTGFLVRTERHCGGMVEGLLPGTPAVSPVRGFGGDGARRRRYGVGENAVTYY